ncbi:MAG: hypothetical protein JWM93_3392 [Frankiales bacterium]|jgi:hypothetical protein|nr:hypothetical protein [Frankiales bacterium]
MAREVIIRGSGDLMRFSSIEEAAEYIEPIDVRNGEWTAWDSAGQRLAPAVESRERGRGWFRTTAEYVVLRPSGDRDPDGLLDAIRERLQVLGAAAPANLEEALEVWQHLNR